MLPGCCITSFTKTLQLLLCLIILMLEHFSCRELNRISAKESRKLPEICGHARVGFESEKIFGGNTVTDGNAYPFAVAVGCNRDTECTGTLISSRHVLTAAHCFVKPYRDKTMRILHSKPNDENWIYLASSKEKVAVTAYHYHTGYVNSLGKQDDIALVELEQELNLTDTNGAKVACLGDQHSQLQSFFYSYGYGYDPKNLDDFYNLVLKELRLHPKDPSDCQQKRNLTDEHMKKLLCIDDTQQRLVCQGDSGGPLLQRSDDNPDRLVLIGTVVSGLKCDEALADSAREQRELNYRGQLFVDVRSYLGWICHRTGICYMQHDRSTDDEPIADRVVVGAEQSTTKTTTTTTTATTRKPKTTTYRKPLSWLEYQYELLRRLRAREAEEKRLKEEKKREEERLEEKRKLAEEQRQQEMFDRMRERIRNRLAELEEVQTTTTTVTETTKISTTAAPSTTRAPKAGVGLFNLPRITKPKAK